MHPAFSLFAATLISILPTHAFAQSSDGPIVREESVSVRDRSRPEYESQGVPLGGFNLNASLDLGVASTDNLFAAGDGNELDDIVYTAAPTARLESDWSRHMVAVEAGLGFTVHDKFDNEDADTHYLRGVGRLDVGDSTSIGGSARIAHQVTPRTDPDSPLIGAPVEYDRNDAAFNVEHRFARFAVRGEVARSEYDYENAQNFRDNEETSFSGRVTADLTPRVGLVLQGVVDERDYDNTPNLNSEGTAVLGGVTVNTDLMRGEILVGQFERDYDDPLVGSFDGVAVAGEVEWYVTRLTTVTLRARRDADDQISATAGQPFVTTEYGARVDHELRRNIILTAAVDAGDRDYDAIDREDEYVSYEVGADWLLNPRAAVRFRYEHDESDSSGAMAYRDYEVNAVKLGVRLSL